MHPSQLFFDSKRIISNDTEFNYYSDSLINGNFLFEKNDIEKFFKFAIAPSAYCWNEVKTEYYKSFWRFDISKEMAGIIGNDQDRVEIFKYVIDSIIEIYEKYLVKNDGNTFKYIYTEKNKHEQNVMGNITIYFPNLILNNDYCNTLRSSLIEKIMKDANELVKDITEDQWDQIINKEIYGCKGNKLLYQCEPWESSVNSVNTYRSTYTVVNTDNITDKKKKKSAQYDNMILTCVRTKKTACNVQFRMSTNKVPLIDMCKYVNQGSSNTTTFSMKVIEKLCRNLSVRRLSDEKTMTSFVFMCKTYGWYELAHKICKRSKKYNKTKVDNIYNKVNKKGKSLTISSLFYWSKADNEEKHLEIVNSDDMINFSMEKLEYVMDEEEEFKDYADLVYSEDYVKDLELDKYNTFIIKAATGTGKTEAIVKSIKKLVDNKMADSITVLASRIVLVENIAARFNGTDVNGKDIGLDLKVYSTLEGDKIRKEKRIIQTPDSLIRMVKNKEINYPDVLFIDEIESLMNYVITSSTLADNRKTIFSILNTYIMKSKYVFLVDSNVSKNVCEYVKNLRKRSYMKDDMTVIPNNKVQVIFNSKKTNTSKYHLVSNEIDWLDRLDKYVSEGKKIFVGTDSKEQTEFLGRKIGMNNPDVRYKVYNCETDDTSKKLLGNVNDEWSNYDVVICSPTVLYGLDFNVCHFDYVFGYYQRTIGASSIYQQLNRARKTNTSEVYIYLDSSRVSEYLMPVEASRIAKYIVRYRKEYMKDIRDLGYDECELFEFDKNSLFNKLYFHFQVESNKCNNDFVKELTKYLVEFGGKFYKLNNRFVRKTVYDKIKENKKVLIKEVRENKKSNIIEASKRRTDAKEINTKQEKTTEEKRILEVNKICNKLNLIEIDEKIVGKLDHSIKVGNLFNSFKYFENPEFFENEDISKLKQWKKLKMAKSLISVAFGEEGILSQKVVVMTNKDKMTKEEQKWWKDNYKEIEVLFSIPAKERVVEPLRIDLYRLIRKINTDYFNKFIEYSIDRKKKYVKGGRDNTIYEHKCYFSADKWAELYLLSSTFYDRPEVLEMFNHLKDKKCEYSSIHTFNTFDELIEEKGKKKADEMIDYDKEDEEEN